MYTHDINRALRVAKKLEAGNVSINTLNTVRMDSGSCRIYSIFYVADCYREKCHLVGPKRLVLDEVCPQRYFHCSCLITLFGKLEFGPDALDAFMESKSVFIKML